MSWDRVIGQQRVKQLLRKALMSGHVAHAYLFEGPEGVGKDALAIEFARALNCREGLPDACGSCQSCRSMDTLQHPNLRFIVALPAGKGEKIGDDPLKGLVEDQIETLQSELAAKARDPYRRINIPKANFIKVNSIREIRRQASLTALNSGRKIFIIAAADEMNLEASNSLLKTLEEPPGDTVLILTTARREQLLPTIVSRCQIVRCEPLSDEEIAGALVEREGTAAEEASIIATASNGSYRTARELTSEDMLQVRHDAVQFVRNALGTSRVALLSQMESAFGGGDRTAAGQRLRALQTWLHEAILLRSHAGDGGSADGNEELKRFVERFPDADLIMASEKVERSIALLDRNVYLPLVLTTLALDLHRCIISPHS